jgi:SAM-dependent methyltransferase
MAPLALSLYMTQQARYCWRLKEQPIAGETDMTVDIAHPAYWDAKYNEGLAHWDLGGPTPVFAALLHSGRLAPGRMMVLGAGAGHDAQLFATHGFTVTAVDFAPAAAAKMRALDAAGLLDIRQADIFQLPSSLNASFDHVLEYTCFCAIKPAQREAYFDLVMRLLKPGGTYVALAFPIVDRDGGPPFAVRPQEMLDALRLRGFALQGRERSAQSVPARRGIEELLILRKMETTVV